MQTLSFCRILIIDKNIVEVILNEGIEINPTMVDEFFTYIADKMNGVISILLNKATKYSYNFEALMQLSVSTKIRHMGVVVYDSIAVSSVNFLNERYNESQKNVKIFKTREDALAWLQEINA